MKPRRPPEGGVERRSVHAGRDGAQKRRDEGGGEEGQRSGQGKHAGGGKQGGRREGTNQEDAVLEACRAPADDHGEGALSRRAVGVDVRGISDGNLVSDNTISNNTSGISLAGTNHQVNCNAIVDNSVGVVVQAGATGIVLTDNQIAGNSVAGVQNFGTEVVNADGNFWGAADGPSPAGSGETDILK